MYYCIYQSGNTARRLAKFRPCAPILAVTFDEVTQRSLLPVNWCNSSRFKYSK